MIYRASYAEKGASGMGQILNSWYKCPPLLVLSIRGVLGIVFKPRPNPVLFESRLVPFQSFLSPEPSLFTSRLVPLASHFAPRSFMLPLAFQDCPKFEQNANKVAGWMQGEIWDFRGESGRCFHQPLWGIMGTRRLGSAGRVVGGSA